MEYYFNPNGFIYRRHFWLFLIILTWWLFETLSYKHYFLFAFLLLFIAVVIVPKYVVKLRIWISKKPLLTVNEFYLLDHQQNKKYYWNDIEEIVADRDQLLIEFKEITKNLNANEKQPKQHFFKRIWDGLLSRHADFSFYISDLAIDDRQVFLDTLDDYSIKAMDLEIPEQ